MPTPPPYPPALRNPIGSHVPVGKGLVDGALATAAQIGAETIQVFTGNPRGWAASQGDPRTDAAFKDTCAEQGMRVFVHAPYLVNLGSPNPETFEKSVATVAHTLRRAAAIGAEGVVVHTGSCVDEGAFESAMRQVGEGLLPVLADVFEDAPWLLLEPTAGQGRSLCATVADVGAYLAALGHHPRVGLCLDTCHVFAAGEPLDKPGGTTDTVDRLVAVLDEGRLRLVHANDSKDVRGSAKDRHERLGDGHIGWTCFEELLAHPAMESVPLILETPGSGQPGDDGISGLKQVRDRVLGERGGASR